MKLENIGFYTLEELSVRPKNDSFGVMFQNKEVLFWTHLTKEEFKKIFI